MQPLFVISLIETDVSTAGPKRSTAQKKHVDWKIVLLIRHKLYFG